MDHQSFASPIQSIYRNSVAEPRYFAHEDDKYDIKSSSNNSRSPATVFAVDDQQLISVFRVPDHSIERAGYLCGVIEKANSSGITSSLSHRRRCLTPSSFTTDGELSTFSEDTEEGVADEDDARISSDNNDHYQFSLRRRRSALSIFRPVSGSKRPSCDFDEDDGGIVSSTTPTKRRCTTRPMLCHANPIGSSDDDSFGERAASSPSSSSTSPFRRIYRSSSITASSSYTPLFTETLPVRADRDPIPSSNKNFLDHPLSFDFSPISKTADSTIKDDNDVKGGDRN